MKRYNPNNPLISVHIPKCAGSSFSNILKEWFNEGYYPHYHNEVLNKPPEKYDLNKIREVKGENFKICIHGHFNNARKNGVLDYYPSESQLITILRNPFDLHVSNFFFVKMQNKLQRSGALRAGKIHHLIANNTTLDYFLFNNPKSHILNFLPPEITLDNYKEILNERFLYIGISENLQNSVNNLADILGFTPISAPLINVSERTETIPVKAKELFEDNNQLEYAIYNYAKSRWNNDL